MENKEELEKELRYRTDGTCNPKAVVLGDKYRFTVLTDCLVRMEYSESGRFDDRSTPVAINRRFDVPEFTVTDTGDMLEIITSKIHVFYNKKEFAPQNLHVDLVRGSRWYFGDIKPGTFPDQYNLGGTIRTLDVVNGETDLGYGLADRRGSSFIDDSASLLLDEDGWPVARDHEETDIYYFGYGHDYYGAVRDFYRLSGNVPLLPRYALGNWWSRYWAYTEKSYLELLKQFEKQGIPFSVGVFDMDWHLVDVPKKYGSGWTGFTWNRKLFPDPERMLKYVHDNGMHITLNLHPADGVRAFEEQYPQMAKALGIDPESEQGIAFDVTEKAFLNAYFRFLCHPMEKQGVDFWWVDWQQGTTSSVSGLDPLWLLNYFHYMDNCRDGSKRGLLLSRYSGPGSHRYPVGFSGDTIMTWESLAFQPYFTATASNLGYTWWSHDIGGHVFGYRDHELAVRWFQLGAFSPINRLHSNKNEFIDKTPWSYPQPYCDCMEDVLRLRHRMIPYIYSMNRRVSKDLVPFITPMYYDYPDNAAVYEKEFRNQYMFGSQLMVVPLVSHTEPETMCASAKAWLPPGKWIDFQTGTVYDGGISGRVLTVSRTIDRMAVFAKAGAVVPMDHNFSNSTSNPVEMDINLYAADSCNDDGFNDYGFDIYEDGGDGLDYAKGVFATTNVIWNGELCRISCSGDISVLPSERTFRLSVWGVSKEIKVKTSNVRVVSRKYDEITRSFTVKLEPLSPATEIMVEFSEVRSYDPEVSSPEMHNELFELLKWMQIENNGKNDICSTVESAGSKAKALASVQALAIPQNVKNAVAEVLGR